MLKFLIFAILLGASPAISLLENLFQAEKSCYTGCDANYGTSISKLEACKQGCGYKLHKENCPDQCKSHLTDIQMQASCIVGCAMYHSEVSSAKQETVEVERPRSIILIRLRQRPSLEIPSFNRIFNNDPVQMFNDMIKQLKENTNEIGKSNEFKTIIHLTKHIPLINSANDDSSNRVHHFILQRQEKVHSLNNRLQQLVNDVRTEWNDLVHKQPKIPVWILVAIFLSSSIILWYMIVSLCRHKPAHHNISIRAQEIDFNDMDEKEKLQYYESSPMKVKLTNI